MKPVNMFLYILLMATMNLKAGDPVKIMPVGNSITAGEHYRYPPVAERTGYRKDLYEMLIDSGYNVDFVGSQSHGIRPDCDANWYDWNNEAYPGWKIPEIAVKVKSALKVYKPDILLVHVGTNGSDWSNKPGQVMEMLDMIDQYSVDYDHPITVFLCKIIKRFIYENSQPTSQFNTDVANAVAARTGDKIKIIMVDMENGAGLDYTDNAPDTNAIPPYEGGDMFGRTYPGVDYDKYHPNDKGNTKMAVKFYEELVKELDPPETIENNKVEGIEIVAVSDTSVKITWKVNFLDEDGYIIERAESGSGFSIIDTAKANTFCFVDSSLNAESEYKYRIKAFNSTGESLYSSEVPYPPTHYILTTSVVGQGSVDPGSGSYLIGADDTITITAIPAPGWEFNKWEGNIISSYRYSNPATIIMDSDRSLTCIFSEISSYPTTQAGSGYRFYPNPVNDELTIELHGEFFQCADVRVMDISGRLILNKKVQGLRHILDMGHLSPGIYLIKVSDNNKETISRYIAKQ